MAEQQDNEGQREWVEKVKDDESREEARKRRWRTLEAKSKQLKEKMSRR